MDPEVLVASGMMRVYIGQRVCRLPRPRERAYHFAEAEFCVLCSTAGVAGICAMGPVLLTVGALVEDSDPGYTNPALVALLLSAGVVACDQTIGERCANRERSPAAWWIGLGHGE